MATDTPKLIFVYNADSGLFNTVTDIAHKILSPDTYACDLCALTHGHFQVRQEWVAFLRDLPVDTEFLHRDEYVKRFGRTEMEFPAVFIDTGTDQEVFLQREDISGCDALDGLKQLTRERLKAHNIV